MEIGVWCYPIYLPFSLEVSAKRIEDGQNWVLLHFITLMKIDDVFKYIA